MGWNYILMDKSFHPLLYWACNYLSMLRLKLNHVSKRGYRTQLNVLCLSLNPQWFSYSKSTGTIYGFVDCKKLVRFNHRTPAGCVGCIHVCVAQFMSCLNRTIITTSSTKPREISVNKSCKSTTITMHIKIPKHLLLAILFDGYWHSAVSVCSRHR